MEIRQTANLNRLQKIGAVAAFLMPLSVYVYYLCPTVAAGDSGEFITSAKILGIPHPPGYPLYTLLSHLFTYLPFQSVAWRVNFSSALYGALTVLIVYLALLRLTNKIAPALAGAGALAFSRFFWHYSEVAEVFPLNNLFVAGLVYVLIILRQKYRVFQMNSDKKSQTEVKASCLRLFYLFSFLAGLALTNHHTFVLIAPAVLFYFWFTMRGFLLDSKAIGLALLFFVAGLTPYLYCPIAAATQPFINWDHPTTLKNFLNLVFRADYGSFSPFASELRSELTVARVQQLPAFFVGLFQQFTALGLALAFMGMVNFKLRKIWQGFLIAGFFFSGIFFVLYANVSISNPLLLGVLHRFYIMPAIFFCLWIGLGVETVRQWLEQNKFTTVARFAPLALISTLIIWQFYSNKAEANFRDNHLAEDFAHNILLSLPENALFFVRGDAASMGVDYLQIVNGVRPDVMILDQAKMTYEWYYTQAQKRYPKINLPGVRYDGAQIQNRHLIASNIQDFPVCFMDFKEDSYQQTFRALPVGLVYRMVPNAQAINPVELEKRMNELFSRFKMRGLNRSYPPTSFENEIKKIYAEPFFRLAYEFEQSGNFTKAEVYYNKALTMNPNNYKILKNLAVLKFYKLNQPKEAVDLFKRYLKMNPADSEATSIRQIINSVK
ncbi:MAG: protein O-mannosyl-transferase family [bacterium]